MSTTQISGNAFLAKLRSETAHSHASLEELPFSRMLLAKDVTIRQYREYLGIMYLVVRQAEENVFPLLQSVIPDLEKRCKSSLIGNDLEKLGYTVPDLSENFFESGFNTVSSAYGLFYVLEGSSLGGKIISRSLSQVLGDQMRDADSYLNVYGKELGEYWRKFLSDMCSYEMTSSEGDEIIRGAVVSFNIIHDLFNRQPVA
jgi:heme oxygenase